MTYPPCSHFWIADEASLMLSMWIDFRVGFGGPHQLLTAAKSTDCFATRPVILNGPVPIAVAAFVHQLSKSCLTAFWSTSIPVESVSEMAARNQPAGNASWTFTVKPVGPSGAVSPDMLTDASLFSSSVSRAAPTAVVLAASW